MKPRRQPNRLRLLSLGERAFEILVGVLVAVLALVFFALPLGGIVVLLSPRASDRADWGTWAAAVFGCIVGWWCAQTAWRLFTRHERPGGGLLSPLTLLLAGVGCVAAGIAIGVFWDATNLAWIRFMGLGLGCVGLARYRWRREHNMRSA